MPGLRYETGSEEAAQIEKAVIAKMMAYAVRKGFNDPIIRDILPNEDLKGAGEVGSGYLWQQDLSACQYHTVYSGENDENRAICIFKVANVSEHPITAALRFHAGYNRTAIIDIWQVEHAWLNPGREGFCKLEDVIFYGKKAGYNIDFLSFVNGMDNVILGGKVVEPRGKTITPKKALT